jgi:hypothetical protein
MDEAFLVLEITDSLVGEFDTQRRVVQIDPGALREISLVRGVVRDRLCIRPSSPDAFSVIPGDPGLELQLKNWRRHRGRVEAVVDALRRRTSSNP